MAGLEVAGQMRSEETVLVTAAAGGTGQFVVQLAKAAGNHVIATCGSRWESLLTGGLGTWGDTVQLLHQNSLVRASCIFGVRAQVKSVPETSFNLMFAHIS